MPQEVNVSLRLFYAYGRREPKSSAAFLRPFYEKQLNEEVICMTLNMLFFTITIKKNQMTMEECLHQENIDKLRNQYIDKAITHRNMF
jgi:uncharacterized protein (TIGR02413 family)